MSDDIEDDKKSRRAQVPMILLGLVASLLVATPLLAAAIFVLACGGYASCKRPRWLRIQRCLAWFIGGFAAGAGLVLLAIFDRRHRAAIGWACLVSIWVGATAVFRALERAFSLVPRTPSARARPRAKIPALGIAERGSQRGRSAWDGDGEGTVGRSELRWRFECHGEIAMGGPTFGTLEISNGITLESVGPSVAFSSDGELGAVSIPSRNEWQLWLISVARREVRLVSPCVLWEIDEVNPGWVYGRHSPLVSDRGYQIAIEDIMRLPPWCLVEQGGRWKLPSG